MVKQLQVLVTDLEVIEYVKKIGLSKISRDDFVMRIYTKKLTESEPTVNDVCGYGYNVVNSETGFSPIRIEHFIYRSWCSNGASVPILHGEETLFSLRK